MLKIDRLMAEHSLPFRQSDAADILQNFSVGVRS
jgi:hypothetical protein